MRLPVATIVTLVATSLAAPGAPAQTEDAGPEPREEAPPPTDGGTRDGGKPDAGPTGFFVDARKRPGGKIKATDLEAALRDQMDPQAPAPPIQQTLVDGYPTDKLGLPLPETRPFPVAEVLADAGLFEGQRIMLRGAARRTCVTGCWVEVAEFPSAPTYVRVVPTGGAFQFMSSTRPRRILAVGTLRRARLSAAEARAVDQQAGERGRGKPRTDWVLECDGAQVQWLE